MLVGEKIAYLSMEVDLPEGFAGVYKSWIVRHFPMTGAFCGFTRIQVQQGETLRKSYHVYRHRHLACEHVYK